MPTQIVYLSDHEPVTTNYLRQDVLRLMYGIMLETRRAGMRIHYCIQAQPLGPFVDSLKLKKYDGAIFVLKGFGTDARKQLAYIGKRMPCVACMVKPPLQSIPYIGTDIRHGFKEQIERLMEHGHRTFGYLGSFYGKHSIDRFTIVRDLLEARHVVLKQKWIPGFYIGSGTPRIYDARIKEFLDDLPGDTLQTNTIMGNNADLMLRKFLENREFPDAVLCEYDHFAHAFYMAAAKCGIRIPETFALASFGNEKFSFPPHDDTFLSTMHEDFTEIGKMCVQKILGPWQKGKACQDILLKPVQIPGLSEYRGKPDLNTVDMVQFKQAVQSTIAEDKDTEDLSAKLAFKTHLSKRYFLQRFKVIYHRSFRDFINDLRFERASFMLKNSSESIIQIALRCGFNNIQPFNRLFKLRYGKTPTAYRGPITP